MAQALAKTIATPLPGEAAVPAAKPSASVGAPALVQDGGARRRAARDRRNWTVQYVYLDDAGKTKLTIVTLSATSYEAAKAYAVKHAPGKEFILSLHPESEEQFLGQVRYKAWALSGT